MLARLLSFFSLVLGMVIGQQHICKNQYNPFEYIGKPRAPKDCKLLQLDCPSSWKSGIPQGSESSSPLIYETFLKCHEGFTLCGYVPLNPKTGDVLGQSGVTVGSGVDLGSKSRESFASLLSTLVDKIEPYFGLKRNQAACAAIERPLQLTLAEAKTLTTASFDDFVKKVSARYNKDKTGDALVFESIPRGIRTAIVSVWYQFGNPEAYPSFWGFVKKNDWRNAIKELRNFYSNPETQKRGDLRRRNNEADIMEATLAKCKRSLDVVFLLDESGSVRFKNFIRSLDFVKSMIKAFPDEKLDGKNDTRFGFSTFSHSYESHFFLSNYKTQSAYLSAITRVSYGGGGTKLGNALKEILTDQFREQRGLRPEEHGLPRILIVLTDGISFDNVSIPAKNVRDENIVIYAIGIGNYNFEQLQEIASSRSHIYTLAHFSQLEKFISTLTSSTCYEPRPVSLNETITTNVEKNAFQYFTYRVNKSSNLEIKVNDITGNTKVYGSRTNPHPYKYDNDVAFDLATQKNKILVISANTKSSTKIKRSADDELTRELYVSVTSETNSASFRLEGNECDPRRCKEGTNEMLSAGNTIRFASKHAVIIFAMFMMLFNALSL